MKQFPESIHSDNIENFKEMYLIRVKCYLRKELYEFLLGRKEERDYFNLESFQHKFLPDRKDDFPNLYKEVVSELREKGWKSETSYGGTGLFLFINEIPENCYPDDQILN